MGRGHPLALILAAVLAGSATSACSQEAIELPPIERIVVEKAARRMVLYSGGQVAATFGGLQLGDQPQGHKHFEGDERTPEGLYAIAWHNPQSAYHLSLKISYPNPADRAYAASLGRSPGGLIFIHGQPNDLPTGRIPGDWTDGCIALSNDEVEALYDAVADGTPIEIRP